MEWRREPYRGIEARSNPTYRANDAIVASGLDLVAVAAEAEAAGPALSLDPPMR
jgi:hypothetical protein